MFYYIFFLRPPPTHAAPGSLITFTPKVANDLRTEDFPSAEELFYSWAPVDARAGTQDAEYYPQISAPQKLTVWRPGNFKEVSVPLPPRAREGQAFRLVLTTRAHARAHVANLAASPATATGRDEVGARPFPVMSMPIVISARARAEKQQEIERVYRIPLLPGKDGFLKVKEQTSFDLDKKIWDSGIGLSSWLVELLERPSGEEQPVSRARDALLSSKRRRIIELGAGTGIVSLTLGALRSARTNDDAGCILTTDLDSALPILTHNIATNAAGFTSNASRPQPLALDWDAQLPSVVQAIASQGGFDAIVMADVTYNTASFPALVRTLAALVALSPPESPGPMIVLGYKERDAEERTLWDLVKEVGVSLERVGERSGAGREPVEVWVGTCRGG